MSDTESKIIRNGAKKERNKKVLPFPYIVSCFALISS